MLFRSTRLETLDLREGIRFSVDTPLRLEEPEAKEVRIREVLLRLRLQRRCFLVQTEVRVVAFPPLRPGPQSVVVRVDLVVEEVAGQSDQPVDLPQPIAVQHQESFTPQLCWLLSMAET